MLNRGVSFYEAETGRITTIGLTVIAQVETVEHEPSTQNSWTDQALCKGRVKLFFAPRAERPEARHRRELRARQICGGCVVASICREYARDHHEYGFWGGESEEERHLAGYTLAAPIGIRSRHP